MTTYISSTTKTHPEEWMHLMCKLLAITFSKLWEKQCPHLVTLVIQVAGQQVHQSGSVGLSSTALDALQFGLLSKGPGVGVLTCTHSWRPWLGQCPMGCWSSPHSTGREQISWHWRNETDSSWASLTCKMVLKGALEKTHLNRGRKLSPWSCSAAFYCCRRCWQPPSLGDLSKVVELKVYLGRHPNTQGSCSDLAPQCAFRWPKGLLDPSASTMATDIFFHWPLYLVPAACESILKQRPLRKVQLQQWGLSMKVSEEWPFHTVVHMQSM